MVALSVPTFWFGLIGIYIFTLKLGWVPAGNMYAIGDGSVLDYLHHLILPSLVLSRVHRWMALAAQSVAQTRSLSST